MYVPNQPDAAYQDQSEEPSFDQPPRKSVDYFLLSKNCAAFVAGKSNQIPFRRGNALLFLILLILVTAFILYFTIPLWTVYSTLQAASKTINAKVTNLDITTSTGKNGTTYSYYVTYQFKTTAPNGDVGTYTRRAQVYNSTYHNMLIGSSLPILYSPTNPNISMLVNDSEEKDNTFGLIGLTVGSVIATLLLLYYLCRVMIYDARLGKHGKFIQGNLLSLRGRWISGKGAHYEITLQFDFIGPDGMRYNKSVTRTRNDLRNQTLPKQGTPVAVVFLDPKHFEAL